MKTARSPVQSADLGPAFPGFPQLQGFSDFLGQVLGQVSGMPPKPRAESMAMLSDVMALNAAGGSGGRSLGSEVLLQMVSAHINTPAQHRSCRASPHRLRRRQVRG